MTRRLLLCLVPSLLCLAAMIGVEVLAPDLPVLLVRVSIGWLLFITGLLITFLLIAIFLLRWLYRIRVQDTVQGEKRMQAEAQTRFLRRLDHELKNPLTGLRASIANLEEARTGDPLPAVLPDLRLQVERMVRLTGDLRKLADLDEILLERSAVDVGNLLEEIVDALRSQPLGAGRDIRLVIPRVPWPLPTVMADADLLGSAFFNLIDNALKFSRQPDTVEIRAAEHDHLIQVEIADSGPGIPGEELPRIFEELYRGSNVRGSEGSGLGLALVERIIERHGGRITVRSRMDDVKGTVFTVILPSAGPAERVTER